MITEKLPLKAEIDNEYLYNITMPVPFEDEIDDFINTLRTNIDKESLSYNPNESFTIISSEREPKCVFGYILFDNQKKSIKEVDSTRFHRLTYIGLVSSLFCKRWLVETFHTIFHKIIKYDTENDKAITDIVWFEFNGMPYSVKMNKTYDIYDNVFIKESETFADYICKITNASKGCIHSV